jgi:ABC-type multidrug transport system fused ATPase/permease subunit
VYLINKLVKKKVVAISHELAIHQRSRTHIIENFYSNILFWKVKNLYEKLKSSFDQENTVLANNSASLNFLQQIPRTTFELFIFLIFSILALLNIENTSQIFTSYIIMSLAALKLLPSAVKVSSFIQSALSSASITNSLNEIINNKSLKNKINSKIIIKNFENIYEFKNISFRYKNRVILNECNFIFKKNEIISISGSSGAGKSTFLEIFLRLIDATSGKIILDDQDITNTPIDFSRLIGIVPQSVEFINGTLRENLLLGINVDVSDEKIFKILSKCNLIELINKLPQSLETIIDNHSNFFSGGEKQRIAIARSLLDVDVKILIFDEITSALDKSNSIKLLENIMLFKHQYSIIFITHDDLIKNYCEKNYMLENKTLKLLTK